LGTQGGILVFLKLMHVRIVLCLRLALVESSEFLSPHSLFFLLLLLSELEFFIANAPELSEFFILLLCHVLFLVVAGYLQSSAALNSQLHLKLASLLLFKQSVGLLFGFLDLLV